MTLLGKIQVEISDSLVEVSILKLDGNPAWYFLKPADPRIFAGVRHPYDVDQSGNLLRDALFFGAATSQSLPAIDPQADWTLLLQDWEAATTALAALVSRRTAHSRFFLTLHNSYDSPATDASLLEFGINPLLAPGNTILERALSIVEQPVFTVSTQFADDFQEEELQREVMAPHIQSRLEDRLIGIDNGLFTELAIPEDLLAAARGGDYLPLEEWKNQRCLEAQAALKALRPSPERQVWGNIKRFRFAERTWFVLAGRDDPRQKGYDVACLAIEEFLENGGQASFLLFPIPGDEGLPGLSFLADLATSHPGDVLVLPFVFQEGYFATLRASTYGIMPSFYEPFGMANEFYLNGCVGIGRATGGIIQQIIPYRAAASFNQAVERRANRFYSLADHPTGFLYRERDGIVTAIEDWQSINRAGYRIEAQPKRVEQRKELPLFQAMVAELTTSLWDAVDLFSKSPDLYFRMLTNGISYLQNTFSWKKTAQAYLRHIE
jgi:glycogen synthase